MKVVKVGGSLLERAREVMGVLKEYEVLVVPGGGVFADTIREVAENAMISQKTAHIMAILATHQYGHMLSDLSGLPTVSTLACLKGSAIMLPLDDVSRSELEESWDVTSDTMACYVARLLGKEIFYKLTDVDGIKVDGRVVERINAGKLLNTTTCVDKSLPSCLQDWNMNCQVVNGRRKSDIRKALDGHQIGTLIIGGR